MCSTPRADVVAEDAEPRRTFRGITRLGSELRSTDWKMTAVGELDAQQRIVPAGLEPANADPSPRRGIALAGHGVPLHDPASLALEGRLRRGSNRIRGAAGPDSSPGAASRAS